MRELRCRLSCLCSWVLSKSGFIHLEYNYILTQWTLKEVNITVCGGKEQTIEAMFTLPLVTAINTLCMH